MNISQAWADETLALWRASEPGRRPTTYLNYAVGNELLEYIYGYHGQVPKLQAWRPSMILKTSSDGTTLLSLIEEPVDTYILHFLSLHNKLSQINSTVSTYRYELDSDVEKIE